MRDLLTQSPQLSRNEAIAGWSYYAFSMLALPIVLSYVNALLPQPLNEARLNFVYYVANFTAVLLIFRRFLKLNLQIAVRRLFPVLWYALLGYLGYSALTSILTSLIRTVAPGFANVNDMSIAAMAGKELTLMAIGTVFLVPVAEELFYRGLMLRHLAGKSRILAYCVSMGVFALVHVVGYIGVYEPLTLLLCFIQYLPAGYCLAWCYANTGTIATPILMHMIVNAYGLANLR